MLAQGGSGFVRSVSEAWTLGLLPIAILLTCDRWALQLGCSPPSSADEPDSLLSAAAASVACGAPGSARDRSARLPVPVRTIARTRKMSALEVSWWVNN